MFVLVVEVTWLFISAGEANDVRTVLGRVGFIVTRPDLRFPGMDSPATLFQAYDIASKTNGMG